MITHGEWLLNTADGLERRLDRARRLRGRAREAYYDAAIRAEEIPGAPSEAAYAAWKALQGRCAVLKRRWDALAEECQDLAERLHEVEACYA